jgi:hypothetical protein
MRLTPKALKAHNSPNIHCGTVRSASMSPLYLVKVLGAMARCDVSNLSCNDIAPYAPGLTARSVQRFAPLNTIGAASSNGAWKASTRALLLIERCQWSDLEDSRLERRCMRLPRWKTPRASADELGLVRTLIEMHSTHRAQYT